MNTLILFGAEYLYLVVVIFSSLYIWRQSREMRWKILLCMSIALPLTYIVAKIFSLFYYNARPFVVDHFTPLLAHANDNGFPSDHTLLSSAIAINIFFFQRRLGIVLLIISVMVGTARVFAGIHHSVDIVGSILISGGVVSLVFFSLFPKIWSIFSQKYFSSTIK